MNLIVCSVSLLQVAINWCASECYCVGPSTMKIVSDEAFSLAGKVFKNQRCRQRNFEVQRSELPTFKGM